MRFHGFALLAVAGLLVLAQGCATKKFVTEELGKTETKLGQEVGRLQGEVNQEKSRLSGVATQTTEARAVADAATRRAEQATALAGQAQTPADEATQKAGQAATRAEEAGTVAGQALAKAEQTDSRLTRLWMNRTKRNLADTVVVLFGFDKWQLDDRAQSGLLDVVKQLQDNPSLIVDLEGYTDSAGSPPYNLQLSQRRVEAVRRFLFEKGVDLGRVQSIGLGDSRPAADNKSKQGRDQNRRVSVKLFVPAE